MVVVWCTKKLKRFSNNSSDCTQGPMIDAITRKPIWKYQNIDVDGFPFVGTPIEPKQVWILELRRILLINVSILYDFIIIRF